MCVVYKSIAAAQIVLSVVLFFAVAGFSGQAVVDEQFDSLSGWEPLFFPKINTFSEYTVVRIENGSMLRASSSKAASALLYTEEFDVRRYPVVRWRWKVENIYAAGNLQEKAGDDYPLRIYIIFKYDPDKADLGDKIQYSLARMIYGRYPPHSSLNYIWANRKHPEVIYSSPYTDRAKLIIVRSGESEVGKWLDEEVNVLEDYQKAFGSLPPETASIAIMNDSDNTGESSVSYLDFIQVLPAENIDGH